MKLTRCPICHTAIHLEALIQDESGRELLALVARIPDWLAAPFVGYLGLFRPATRDLANDRALRLAREVLDLCACQQTLGHALSETMQSMRVKQDEGTFKPLSNHRYLKRVLESSEVNPSVTSALVQVPHGTLTPVRHKSKTAQTIDMLKEYPSPAGIPEWFTRTVCGSLAELMIMGLEGVPAADTMSLVVERFLTGLWPNRKWNKDCRFSGAARLRTAFMETAETTRRWPSIKDVLGLVPKL